MSAPVTTRFSELVGRATALAAGGRRSLLGIAGPPGSGKTTLARALAAAVEGAQHVPMDGFHLADVELDRLGRRDRKGAPDTVDAAGFIALVERLRAAGRDVVYAPAFDRDIEQPVAGSIAVDPSTRLVVTEGNYLLLDEEPWPRLRGLLTEIWWVELPADERTDRLVDRHVEFGKPDAAARAWVRDVDGRNADAVAHGRTHADLVVPGDLRLETESRRSEQ